MTTSFAVFAGQLAGIAGRHLGWRPAEFWSATPAELTAILLPPEGCGDAAFGEAPLGRAELSRLMEQDHD